MDSRDEPTALSTHTLESLCDELAGGNAVRLADESVFRLASPDARAAFGWYRAHRQKWGRAVVKEDVESIVDQVTSPAAPDAYRPVARPTTVPRTLHLKSVRAHRFAGLHRFGTVAEPPPEFYLEFDKPLTLIDGDNGAGKTSILNAVVWCLTGYIYRPQRPPEPANQAVPIQLAAAPGSPPGEGPVMSPITPLPPEEVLRSLGDQPLPLDTWVELAFVDNQGREAGTIRRKVQRGAHNSVVVREPDFAALGLAPIAREIGTRMTGLLPYLGVGAASDLGRAVAELIGIKPLQDLARHAEKARERLLGALRREREAAIQAADREYAEAADRLRGVVGDHPHLDPGGALPEPTGDGAGGRLEALDRQFANRQAEMLAGAQAFLGGAFDYNDPAARKGLLADVGPALGALDAAAVKNLPSAARLDRLAALPPAAVDEAERLIRDLLAEAEELNDLARQPDVAARLRLYARVSGWLRELSEPVEALTECPVCRGALAESSDPLTGRAVAEHLREHLDTGRSFLEKTPRAWEEHALVYLRGGLHESLLPELGQDLPSDPGALLSKALTEELFEPRCFRGTLAPLRAAATALCAATLADLPPFTEPARPALPEAFSGRVTGALGRLTRAIAFARWCRDNDSAWRDVMARVADPDPGPAAGADNPDPQSMHGRLTALDQLVKSTAPLASALAAVASMARALAARGDQQRRIGGYEQAAAGLDALSGLGQLVDNQVASLTATLSAATLRWKTALYSPAFVDAPQVTATGVESDGRLVFDAVTRGTAAPAQHVSNASDLRASLLAFLLAFSEYLKERHGGLSLLFLDEPQELCDRSNRRRLANTLPAVVATGARVVVTTSSPGFARRVAAAAKALPAGAADLAHLRVHPLRAARARIALGQHFEAVEEKRRAFEHPDNENEARPARDYLKDLRIYLENRLLDMFDGPDPGLPKQPTLSDLIGAVRTRVNSGMDAFSGTTVRDLVGDPDFAPGSAFLALLNESHHGGEDEITYHDVVRVKDTCVRVRKLVEAAHEEFELWLRRDPREAPPAPPPAPAALAVRPHDVPVFESLAAFTRDARPGEVERSDEPFRVGSLANHAAYLVNTHNFGFAAPRNARAVVDLGDEPVADNRLVIALHRDRVYARRLLRHEATPGLLALASEAENPSKRPPSLFLPAGEVRLLKVVGVLFDDRPVYPKPEGEAALVVSLPSLMKVEVAFRVRGESALPLALPGQLVLGGPCVLPDGLKQAEGQLVAISSSEGDVFKRVGRAIPGAPHVRQFESIGGKGESMLVQTEEVEGSMLSQLPVLISARLVLGVLYL